MSKKLFDCLLNQFEQAYCLDSYVAWKNDSSQDSRDIYSHQCRVKNKLVQDAFIASGEEGIRYLIRKLNSTNEDVRETAITILGEIGNKTKTHFNLADTLAERAKKESRSDILRRIRYSLRLLSLSK